MMRALRRTCDPQTAASLVDTLHTFTHLTLRPGERVEVFIAKFKQYQRDLIALDPLCVFSPKALKSMYLAAIKEIYPAVVWHFQANDSDLELPLDSMVELTRTAEQNNPSSAPASHARALGRRR